MTTTPKPLTPAKRAGKLAELEFLQEDSLYRASARCKAVDGAVKIQRGGSGPLVYDLLYMEQEISAAYRELQSARRAQDAIDRLTVKTITVQS